MCMGDKGRISRAVAPIMGNYLSFATLDQKSQSAPGQFTVGDMKQIHKLLKDENAFPAGKDSFRGYTAELYSAGQSGEAKPFSLDAQRGFERNGDRGKLQRVLRPVIWTARCEA